MAKGECHNRVKLTKNITGEFIWAEYRYKLYYITNPHKRIPKPIFEHNRNANADSDTMKLSDDATIIVNNASEIYPKHKAFDMATDKFRLPINWGKVTILVKNITLK